MRSAPGCTISGTTCGASNRAVASDRTVAEIVLRSRHFRGVRGTTGAFRTAFVGSFFRVCPKFNIIRGFWHLVLPANVDRARYARTGGAKQRHIGSLLSVSAQ